MEGTIQIHIEKVRVGRLTEQIKKEYPEVSN